MAEFHQIAGYDVVATLGKGAASTLYSVRDKTGAVFCLKRVVKNAPNEQRYLDQAIGEYEIAKLFDSPLLRKVHKLIRQRALIRTNEVLVLMELIEGKTIDTVKVPSQVAFCKLFGAAAKGLKLMHDLNYVHADIKPTNIMLDTKGRIKLIDLGQSCKHGVVKERIQGTPDYIAPEQVLRRPITFQTDIFNLGATMYWMLTGKFIPTLIPKKEEGVAIRDDKPGNVQTPKEMDPSVPPALSNLVMECVQTEPNQRPESIQAVIDRLGIAMGQAERAEHAENLRAEERRNAG